MKRKLLSTLAFLCLTVSSAWAAAVNCGPEDIGKLLGSDGNVYDNAPSGVTISGMIAYVNSSEHWGLVIGPVDLYPGGYEGPGKLSSSDAVISCNSYDRPLPAAALSSWRLPSKQDFDNMIGADGCQSIANLFELKGRQGATCANNAGIWKMQTGETGYWSSTASTNDLVYYLSQEDEYIYLSDKTDQKYVRPCFTFNITGGSTDATVISYIQRTATGEGTSTTVTETTQTCTEYKLLTGRTTSAEYGSGWYVVRGDVYIPGTLTFTDDAYLILCDGASLNVQNGIEIFDEKTLTVYGQENNTGEILAHVFDSQILIPAIGCRSGSDRSRLVIHGGTVKAVNEAQNERFYIEDRQSCGIGVWQLTIYGGIVIANGGNDGAGISNSSSEETSNNSGFVRIYGGTVKAKGGEHAPGICCDADGAGPLSIYGGTVTATGGSGAAGIGGYYEDAHTLAVNIYGGTVIAKAGDQSGSGNRAIGPGNGSDKYGTVTIGNKMTVWAGTESSNNRKPVADRTGACQFNPYAKIAVCGHSGYTYTINGTSTEGTHTVHCQYCSVNFAAEKHTFDTDNKCTICGVTQETYAVTIYLPKDGGANGKYEATVYEMVPGATFNLPASPIVVSGMEFEGWLVGTATNGSYLKAEGETLLNANKPYTVNGNVSLTARYKPSGIILANDDTSYANTETLVKNNGMTVGSVTLQNRTLWKDRTWNTLCLPFDLEDSDTDNDHPAASGGIDGKTFTGTELEGATVKTLSTSSFDEATGILTLTFSGDQTSIEAGKPYIVKWATQGQNITDPVFNDVIIKAEYHAVATDYVSFMGSYMAFGLEANDRTMLYLGANNTLYYPSAAMTVGACRAVFELKGITAGDPANGVRSFVLDFGEGETTSLNEELRMKNEESAGAWYDLSGRNVLPHTSHLSPLKKGVYINNGKKVVIK